jgi:hypothetical protein
MASKILSCTWVVKRSINKKCGPAEGAPHILAMGRPSLHNEHQSASRSVDLVRSLATFREQESSGFRGFAGFCGCQRTLANLALAEGAGFEPAGGY